MIRAESAGEIRITQMYITNKRYQPRIECATIGRLQIENLVEGVVWSGRLEYQLNADGTVAIDSDGRPIVANDPTNDYAQIGEMRIGCIGSAGQLWYKDCPLAKIVGDHRGQIFTPRLDPAQRIHIGRVLGIRSAVCDCTGVNDPVDCAPGLPPVFGDPEASPRPYREVKWGKIIINEAAALNSQIIINQENILGDADTLWAGDVIVGSVLAQPPVIRPPHTSPPAPPPEPDLRSPYYKRPSTPLGGGAVGLAPFHLYETDCQPPHDPIGTSTGFTVPEINGTGGAVPRMVMVTFYGPIKKPANTSWSSRVKVRARPFWLGCTSPGTDLPQDGSPQCDWVDVTSAFNIYGPGGNGPDGQPWPHLRSIGVRVKNGHYVAPGIYQVNPTAAGSVQCQDVIGNPPVVWPSLCVNDESVPRNADGAMGYGFAVSGDCDGDQIMDQYDCSLTGPGCSTSCFIADFNQNGTVTVQDIFDFLAAYFYPCMGEQEPPCNGADADVNSSGSVTVQDIFDFLAAYFGAGNC